MSNVYKKDFPIFASWRNQGKSFFYLDSAATAQMPQPVFAALESFQRTNRANVHRGIYEISEAATQAYENARGRVAKFLHAQRPEEIVFTRNTTESLNLIAYSLGKEFLKKGDRILISRAEHHSNFLPWRMLETEVDIILDIVDPDENGEISLQGIQEKITPETKLVSLSHISHVFGTINPAEEIGRFLKERNILFVLDGAQSISHLPIDVKKLHCDFFAFSGHKAGGPMGIGVLYGRGTILANMPPFLRGGGMVKEVRDGGVDWLDIPGRFEAGTPNVEGAIGLSAALDYIESVGYMTIQKTDQELSRLIMTSLQSINGVRVYGSENSTRRGGVVSFSVEGVHPHDVATILSEEGVSVRAGHHCAIPLMKFLGVPALTRASVWMYNEPSDIHSLSNGIEKAIHIIRK